ncbi:MAG: heavy-metal-associated domain-containing protein [Chromatiales bacterium]|jgi:copper chaperone
MSLVIEVENIKCGGCASTIKNKLTQHETIDAVAVDIENGIVTIDGDQLSHDEIAAELLKLGYPEKGTAEGIKAAAAKAKSFVSCAIGRIEGSE